MEEWINFEILLAGKIYNFISPSQSHDVFETIVDNLVLNLGTICNKNPFLAMLGDFMPMHQIGINKIKKHMKALQLML